MVFIRCETPGCRNEEFLARCDQCGRYACPRHRHEPGDATLCGRCAPATPAPSRREGQLELFS